LVSVHVPLFNAVRFGSLFPGFKKRPLAQLDPNKEEMDSFAFGIDVFHLRARPPSDARRQVAIVDQP